MPQNAHGAAKGGVLGLTCQLAVEGGAQGIRVNAAGPVLGRPHHLRPGGQAER